MKLQITILGLSITSSWGNGHATTYRSLVKAICERGHSVLFLERDKPWYASHRDLPAPPFGETRLYADLDELRDTYRDAVQQSDLVIVGSYVPEGVAVGEWVCANANGVAAFYDIDTPVTLAKLTRRDEEYLTHDLIRQYDLYLSFTGGPLLRRLEREFGSPLACPLYCSVDPLLYFPDAGNFDHDLGYLGTYSPDRQEPLKRMMLDAAQSWNEGRFVVAGPQFPTDIEWPQNVERIEHLPPAEHRNFYNKQRFTLNVTRADMVRTGYAPSVRLFEAAACGTPIISDSWPGLEGFFCPGKEIFLSSNAEETLALLREIPDETRRQVANAARTAVLARHTAEHRAAELDEFFLQAVSVKTQAEFSSRGDTNPRSSVSPSRWICESRRDSPT